ncbi:MAG: bifunctional diaminohydroxyphosphoribosylaminopyrimidine deaminase/5-amino-6-(5-phosphoribosylamino)uracil reductase RibD [Planctomycetaceae bacterium]|nr:bifunctional diaminohydroxyphosphoribosylaminopyrimidine deaminase/5-amino-6-(5-phosphoribosylamino)uracil reductase RibD [Planctomycetaceae bacterium]
MQFAIALAKQGQGFVEPNPMVGAVIVDDDLRVIAHGYHELYGGPHAEANAIQAAGLHDNTGLQEKTGLQDNAVTLNNATLFVTLEPCAHQGKTPPCAQAVIAAGIRKVYIGCADPAVHTSGKGIELLRQAGLEVKIGLLQTEAQNLIRPFTKLMTTGLPYVHAKWAMTLDGRIASHTGSSKWISNEQSRHIVHQIRGRMDGILVGAGTVRADDPLLTTRPAGARIATRIVLDSKALLSLDSKLVQSISQAPLIVACSTNATEDRCHQLSQAGVEVIRCPQDRQNRPSINHLLCKLGKRKMTNLLVEGGAETLGTFFDNSLVDEVHVFVAPRIIGGQNSPGPVAGLGIAEMSQAFSFQDMTTSSIAGDLYFNGRLNTQPDE